MKPIVVIESLRMTYELSYMNEQFTLMLTHAFPDRNQEEKDQLNRFLIEGFAFSKILQWQPHKKWTIAEVKEFLELYAKYFPAGQVSGYMIVEEFLKELGVYTAAMLKEPPKKDDFPFWFLSMYLRPAMNS